jgi:hypothetical protein
LTAPAQRHYQKWPILSTYVWPNNYIGQTYQEEINYLKTWIQNRTAWMDANMFGSCNASVLENNIPSLQIYPNPSSDQIQVSGLLGEGKLHLTDLSGKVIQTIHFQNQTIQIDLTQLQNGIYFISIPQHGIYEKFIKN